MWFGLLTLITSIAIAGVAAWFSIAGLMIFFGGMPLSIAIMAGVLEVGKLLTASWLYRYWNETSFALKTYLTSAVIVLMLITSAGIYGYLSKAASDVSSDGAIAFAEVERIDGQIAREENKIEENNYRHGNSASYTKKFHINKNSPNIFLFEYKKFKFRKKKSFFYLTSKNFFSSLKFKTSTFNFSKFFEAQNKIYLLFKNEKKTLVSIVRQQKTDVSN